MGYSGRKIFKVPAIKTNVVDTTGAGDAYCAGFMYMYLKTADVLQAMEYGSKIASKVISIFGTRLQK